VRQTHLLTPFGTKNDHFT
jgi:hypothetical protein